MMKLGVTAVAAAVWFLGGAFTATAHAQPGAYGPGSYAPGPATRASAPWRTGLVIGASLGVGGMESDRPTLVECYNCDEDPASGGGSLHVGWMLNPRFALLFELQATSQNIEQQGRIALTQGLGMVAGQYWFFPRLWIKGGVGKADLSRTFRGGDEREKEPIAEGTAFLGAVGYEVMSRRSWALDAQLRLSSGKYPDRTASDATYGVSTVTLNFGLSWYR